MKQQTKNFGSTILVGLIGVIGFVLYLQWFHPLFQYDIPDNHVSTSFKPIDCDYDSAPVGKKGCHYEKQVMILNKQGEIVGGDGILPNGSHVWREPKRPVTDAQINWVKINDEEAFEYEQQRAHEASSAEGNKAPLAPIQDPAAIELCIRRLKARSDYQPTDAAHVKQACSEDANLSLP